MKLYDQDLRARSSVLMCCTTPGSWLYASSMRKLLSWMGGSSSSTGGAGCEPGAEVGAWAVDFGFFPSASSD